MLNDTKSIDDIALAFAAAYEGKLRYSNHRRKRCWFLPGPHFWYRDTELEVLRLIREFLRDRGGATPSRIAAVERLCRLDRRLAARGDEL